VGFNPYSRLADFLIAEAGRRSEIVAGTDLTQRTRS
jgi:hypothetical protein